MIIIGDNWYTKQFVLANALIVLLRQKKGFMLITVLRKCCDIFEFWGFAAIYYQKNVVGNN